MLNVFKKGRCPRCYDERALRSCPRFSCSIGWKCCNLARADRECPESCSFALQTTGDTPFPAFKAESRSEFQHLIKIFIDFWINQQNAEFDLQTPANVAKSDSTKILHWLSSFKYPAGFPIKYLMDRLGLKHSVPESEINDPEEIAFRYLDALIALRWDEIRQYTINHRDISGAEERYIQVISNTSLKKTKEYSIISTGISEDGSTAFVLLELNHKNLWTLILTPRDGRWWIRQNIASSPQAFYEQSKRYSAIADALGKGDEATAWHGIEDAKKQCPDSADVYYYSGLHSQLIKRFDQAKVDFFTAIALDNEWPLPYFHLANLYLAEQNFSEALYLFDQLSDLNPDDPKVINNIAACYAGMKDYDKAKSIWESMLSRFPDFELAQMNLEKLKNNV